MGGLAALNDALQWVWALLTDPTAGIGIRLAIGSLFVVAGVHKLRDPQGTAQSMQHFGLGALSNVSMARALGVIEALLGLAIVAPPTAWLGGVGCVVMAAAFTFLTARAYRRGEKFACNCLSSSEQPIDGISVARSVALLAAAALVVAAPASTTPFTIANYFSGMAIASCLVGLPLAAVTLQRCRDMTAKFVERVDWTGMVTNWEHR